jgi:hypothetical protein
MGHHCTVAHHAVESGCVHTHEPREIAAACMHALECIRNITVEVRHVRSQVKATRCAWLNVAAAKWEVAIAIRVSS